jgi:ankyrin repeat protein
MNLEECDGYLYMSDVSFAVPFGRLFGIVEFTAFVYKAAEPDRPLIQLQVYRIGGGDGDLTPDGVWRTTPGRRWGTPLTAGDSPLMLPLMRDGALEGEYVVEVGISLITFGVNDEWRLSGWQPPPGGLLYNAADYNNVAAIRSLLAAGADVDARGPFGDTPLSRAASNGHEKSVRLLIKAGADVNAKSSEGYTPLILAARYGRTAVVRLLLEAGADPAVKNNYGMNALYSAGFEGRGETWDVLKAAGAKVGSPAEEMICMAGLGRTAAVERLLAAGVDVNVKGPRDDTALHYASVNGHVETVRLLLARGADVNAPTKYQWAPLNWAMFAHNYEITKMLIKAGADVNHRNAQGLTLLIEAVRDKEVEGVRLLVEAGADVAARDSAGKTALDHALAQANTGPVQEDDPLVKLLRSASAKR